MVRRHRARPTRSAIGYASTWARPAASAASSITTPTPGFNVEVYATDEATPPPNILDSRWAHITDKSNVGVGRQERDVVLGAGTEQVPATLLLWITAAAAEGTRVRISELKVFG